MDERLKQLQEEIKTNINAISDKGNINKIFSIIKPLRKKMDKYDNILVNIKDGFIRLKTHFLGNKKDKIINDLYDVVEGFQFYSPDDKNYTINSLNDIAKIKDRSFWDKLISVLRGS